MPDAIGHHRLQPGPKGGAHVSGIVHRNGGLLLVDGGLEVVGLPVGVGTGPGLYYAPILVIK